MLSEVESARRCVLRLSFIVFLHVIVRRARVLCRSWLESPH
jgi:hypothetical protein